MMLRPPVKVLVPCWWRLGRSHTRWRCYNPPGEGASSHAAATAAGEQAGLSPAGAQDRGMPQHPACDLCSSHPTLQCGYCCCGLLLPTLLLPRRLLPATVCMQRRQAGTRRIALRPLRLPGPSPGTHQQLPGCWQCSGHWTLYLRTSPPHSPFWFGSQSQHPAPAAAHQRGAHEMQQPPPWCDWQPLQGQELPCVHATAGALQVWGCQPPAGRCDCVCCPTAASPAGA